MKVLVKIAWGGKNEKVKFWVQRGGVSGETETGTTKKGHRD